MDSTLLLQQLAGKWYINQTNFPMWLNGSRKNPTFNYELQHKRKQLGLKDVVAFDKNDRPKTIVGFDRPTDETNTSFVWRGKGLLSIAKSEWKILHLDTTLNWMLIKFEKTLFTPAGYDVVSRQKILPQATQKIVTEILRQHGIKETLTTLEQQ